MITHASIIPLIGGETIGAEQAFGQRPEYFLSYSPFQSNDRHVVNYYGDVPYYLLDKGERHPYKVDVVHTICPCAGLSMLSNGWGDDNENNKWLVETTKYVLTEMNPLVFWGENAPGFAGKIGDTVRNQIKTIGKENGYSFSIYRTKTILHGGPQVRERSFYFFWKGDRVPQFNYFDRPYEKIEDVILGVRSNFQTEVISKKTPSIDDPYYRFVLEVIHGGISHKEFSKIKDPQSVRNSDVFSYIESQGVTYLEVGEWMKRMNFTKEIEQCRQKHEKLSSGKEIMRRGTIIPKDHIGAFVNHYPLKLTHPVEDRYINYREAMTIMGLPDTFELVDASLKNVNHICQNVPVQTAKDMATEVLAHLNNQREVLDTDYVLQNNNSRTIHYEHKSNTLENFFV